jgi:hypothetical protein
MPAVSSTPVVGERPKPAANAAGRVEVRHGDAIVAGAEAAESRRVVEEEEDLDDDVSDHGPGRGRTHGVGHPGDAEQQPGTPARDDGGERDDEPVHPAPAYEELGHARRREAGGVDADPYHEDQVGDESSYGPWTGGRHQ